MEISTLAMMGVAGICFLAGKTVVRGNTSEKPVNGNILPGGAGKDGSASAPSSAPSGRIEHEETQQPPA